MKHGVNSNDRVEWRHQVNKLKLYSANPNVGIKGTDQQVHW